MKTQIQYANKKSDLYIIEQNHSDKIDNLNLSKCRNKGKYVYIYMYIYNIYIP